MATESMMDDPREHLVRICKLAYDRKLLDSAGGNVTTRFGDRIYMTRSYAGGHHQWDLRPCDILVLDCDGNILAGEGDLSREASVHLACYRAFPEAGCVFHAHSLHLMPFICRETPLPPIGEQADRFGTIGFCEWAASHTGELAVNVVEGLRPQAATLAECPIATFVPRHGVFVVGADLNSAYEALETLDRNAHIALMARLLD